MKKESKNTKYKQRNILVWNEVAPFYHKRWARKEIGPFNVTDELIKLSKIKSGDNVLDLACGTGLVTKKITAKVGVSGKVFAVDTSILSTPAPALPIIFHFFADSIIFFVTFVAYLTIIAS